MSILFMIDFSGLFWCVFCHNYNQLLGEMSVLFLSPKKIDLIPEKMINDKRRLILNKKFDFVNIKILI